MQTEKQCYLAVYTRTPDPARYPRGLADSVHLAWSEDRKIFYPLHRNYGVLFAVSGINEQNVILREGVRQPRLRRLPDGVYRIDAVRTDRDGVPVTDAARRTVCWETADFITFLPCVAEMAARDDGDGETLTLEDGERVEGSVLAVDAALLDTARAYWTPLCCTGVTYPAEIPQSALEDFRTEVRYTDGSVHRKRVRWDPDARVPLPDGGFRLTGEILQPEYGYPLADGYADPTLFRWEGKTYFLSTNDNTDCVGLWVRELTEADPADPLAGEEALILPYDREKGWIQTFWAPEFHVIGGRLCILFALGGEVWGPQCHIMRLREGGSILRAEDWEEPIRVRRQDGRPLTEDGITLDMTFLPTKRGAYMIWSYRQHIGTPLDSGSMLYIGAVREEEPWVILGDPVLLTRPLYGWENVDGTINNEGPYVLRRGDSIYLTYSGGAVDFYTYAIGLLTAADGADLLQTENWRKSGVPIATFLTDAREFGPGHNSFYEDRDGNIRILYHAETGRDNHFRRTGSRRIHFDRNDRPVWDLSRERDLLPALRRVTITVRGD